MRCEVVAVGTELLLGQIVDTNSSWIGEQLALQPVLTVITTRASAATSLVSKTYFVRYWSAPIPLSFAAGWDLQDDITGDVIAHVMGVGMTRDDAIATRIRDRFERRGRVMPENNLRQADVPDGASIIEQMPGTAPGLVCPLGEKVIYAVPGVPSELKVMVEGTVIPDLRARAGLPSVIGSRVLRTWGQSNLASQRCSLAGLMNWTQQGIRHSLSWRVASRDSRFG